MTLNTEERITSQNPEVPENEQVKEKKLGFSIKRFLCLQLLLFVVSFSAVFTKSAANEPFLSFKFCLFYAGILFLCFVNAIFWQQIIKKLPLTFAYSNRAVGIIWTMIWSRLFFGDIITTKKIIGVVIIIFGILLYSFWGHSGKE